jgi:hypothetical protein
MRVLGPRLVLLAAFLAAVPLACRRHAVEPPAIPAAPVEKLGAHFDPKMTGNISGTVTWADELPEIAPLHVLQPVDGKATEDFPNPNQPTIDPVTNEIEGTLIFLRKVDLATSKPWSHAPVSVVFTDSKLEVRQGAAPVSIGIVQLGDTVACSATVERNFSLKFRGVDFYSMPLPKPNVVTTRKLEKPGAVELSCGRGRYWLHNYLWVSDHPYVTKSKADGSFELKRVPAGDYELVSWMPSWHVLRSDRNPETAEIIRLVFEAPGEQKRTVTVTAGETAETEFSLSNSDFRPREND